MDSSVPRKPLGTSRSSGGCISRVCESTVTQSPGACWSWSWHTGLGVMTPTLPDLTHWGRCTENTLKSPLRRTHQAPTRGQVRAECPGLSHRESFWSLMRPRPPVSLRGDASSLGHMALDAGTTLRSHRCGGQLVLGPRAHAWCLHTAGEEGALKAPPQGHSGHGPISEKLNSGLQPRPSREPRRSPERRGQAHTHQPIS